MFNGEVVEDTASINIASEVGGDVGSFAAGAASNKMAGSYINEMFDTAVSMNQQEKLNFEIFKQTARKQNMDASKVRGTGLARYMQGDICERPERNSRPNSWDNDDSTDDGIILGPGPNINPKTPSNDDGSLNLPGESTIYDSSSYSDETISNTDTDNNDGNIFAKLFGFLGFGGDSGGCVIAQFHHHNYHLRKQKDCVRTLKKHSWVGYSTVEGVILCVILTLVIHLIILRYF